MRRMDFKGVNVWIGAWACWVRKDRRAERLAGWNIVGFVSWVTRRVLLGGVGRDVGGREVRSMCILLVRDDDDAVVEIGSGAEQGDSMVLM